MTISRPLKRLLPLFGAMLLPAAASASQIVTLPGYLLDGSLIDFTAPGVTSTRSVTSTGTTTDSSLGTTSSATFNLGPSPNLTGSAFIGSTAGTSAVSTSEVGTFVVSNGGGTAGYYFEVVGPTGNATLRINASGTVSSTSIPPILVGTGTFAADVRSGLAVYPGGPQGPNQASPYLIADFSQINVSYSGNGGFLPPSMSNASTADVSGSLDTGFSGGWQDTRTFDVSTNTEYFVNLLTYAKSLGQNAPAPVSGTAVVDPTFTIVSGDPGDSLIFSPGVGNSGGGGGGTPIPEPASVALLAFAALGMLGLRRRRASACGEVDEVLRAGEDDGV